MVKSYHRVTMERSARLSNRMMSYRQHQLWRNWWSSQHAFERTLMKSRWTNELPMWSTDLAWLVVRIVKSEAWLSVAYLEENERERLLDMSWLLSLLFYYSMSRRVDLILQHRRESYSFSGKKLKEECLFSRQFISLHLIYLWCSTGSYSSQRVTQFTLVHLNKLRSTLLNLDSRCLAMPILQTSSSRLQLSLLDTLMKTRQSLTFTRTARHRWEITWLSVPRIESCSKGHSMTHSRKLESIGTLLSVENLLYFSTEMFSFSIVTHTKLSLLPCQLSSLQSWKPVSSTE